MQYRAWIGVLIAATAMVLGGCASEGRYIYRPEQQVTATVSSLPAARYSIPPERPAGEVLIASSGITQLPNSDARTPALFVRVIVTNNSDDTPWTLDTRQQFAWLGGEWQSPANVNGYGQSSPVIQVTRGEKRLVDMYYRLPPKADGDEEIPRFELAWTIQTAARVVAERTSFDRLRVEPAYVAGTYYPYGPPWWGPYGWYDPFGPYPYWGFHLGYHFGYGSRYRGYSVPGRYYGPSRGGYIRAPAMRR
jgi:hypothetical protein